MLKNVCVAYFCSQIGDFSAQREFPPKITKRLITSSGYWQTPSDPMDYNEPLEWLLEIPDDAL